MALSFEKYPKIPRRKNIFMLVTEKLDGTNAQINIDPDPAVPLLVGSRNRVITPNVPGNRQSDNFGFAQWVSENEAMLRRLGPGRHYGEWWGAGVGRRYGLETKSFSLFDALRWSPERIPEGCPVSAVPVLYYGPYSHEALEEVLAKFKAEGSKAVPGWMEPEGAVVRVGDVQWKEIFDKQGPSPEESE